MNLSVFDVFKVGVGPSSSHTMGPMLAARFFVLDLESKGLLARTEEVYVQLYGSLALTGLGHCTDRAILLGLEGHDPSGFDPAVMEPTLARIRGSGRIRLLGRREIAFDEKRDLVMNKRQKLPYHTNGMRFTAFDAAGTAIDAENVLIPMNDFRRLTRFAKENNVGLTVVGPEAPLAEGVVDAFQAEKLKVFGPTKAAAQLEASKVFCKNMLRAADVPQADYRVFKTAESAQRYIEDRYPTDTQDVPFAWKGTGCVNGRTQYGFSQGVWNRVLVPNDDQEVSVNSFDPARREFHTERYLLSQSAMQQARAARAQYTPPVCGAEAAAATLGEQQRAVLDALPARPNERLVYMCEVATK